MKTLKLLVLTLTATVSLLSPTSIAHAQTQSGCYPPVESSSGPVSITLWCQVLDYSSTQPLAVGWDTGLITLQRGFSPGVGGHIHLQYDNWYSAMDTTFQMELLSQDPVFDIVTFPFSVQYDGATTWLSDIPLGVALQAGDRIRITGASTIPHTCNAADNCGMRAVFTLVE